MLLESFHVMATVSDEGDDANLEWRILATNIKRLRDLKGWSQTRLSDEAGTTSVAMIESGSRKKAPSVHSIRKIARALGVHVEALYSDPDRIDPTLEAFLASDIAADITDDERLKLRLHLLPEGQPTMKSWMYALEEIRAMRRDKP